MAQRWNISPEILRGMGDRTVYPTAKEAAVTSGDRLNEICTLSECVAQSTDPTAYPGAAKRWSDIRATFEQRAGKSALRRLGDALEANCKVYLKVSPTLFQVPPEIAPAAPAIEPTVSRFERNPFTQRCPEHVQSLFRDLYDSLEGTTGERAAATLLQTIAPTLGFKSGCVFIHETESDLLKPRFTAGDRRPIDYPALPAHGSGADPVTVTFLKVSSRAPLKDTGAITGALGEARHHGVLKLVLGPALRGQPAAEVELLFEAFRKTLEDCLEIY